MSRKQYFSGSNNFRGLEEAINTLAEDSDDDLEYYDLAIIPPEPSVVTDEEEGDVDMTLRCLPNDVPGNIEINPYPFIGLGSTVRNGGGYYSHMIDMAMANAWSMQVIAKEEPMDQLLF
ncbi:unnamed protein product [Euphydryas editha]|uniref:Uncharacterized protein n=1 Tax=Euphydryas editha TaxID=104508 RepID=A0AAU9TL36_EUPED|nr:unnamed protein product [Euphydryas editha]